jgi:hypothetical protein
MIAKPQPWRVESAPPPSGGQFPAEQNETAIQYASDRLAFWREFPSHHIPATVADITLIGFFLPPTRFLTAYPWREFISEHHAVLIDCVRKGWQEGADLLCDFAEALIEEEKPVPLWLQEYLVGAARSYKYTIRRRGRDPYAHVERDNEIVKVVERVADLFGLRVTRNAATQTECACSIVAKALKRMGFDMSEATVAALWGRRFRPRQPRSKSS